MSVVDTLLPDHAAIAEEVRQADRRAAAAPDDQKRLDRFAPWILGLQNMIEEGDWQHARTFLHQISARIRDEELAAMQDEMGVARRN